MKILRQIKLFWIKLFGKPYEFPFVNSGKPVGLELKAGHLTYHDMAEHACRCRLAEEVILNNLDANAIKIIDFKRINGFVGTTTFQPCKV